MPVFEHQRPKLQGVRAPSSCMPESCACPCQRQVFPNRLTSTRPRDKTNSNRAPPPHPLWQAKFGTPTRKGESTSVAPHRTRTTPPKNEPHPPRANDLKFERLQFLSVWPWPLPSNWPPAPRPLPAGSWHSNPGDRRALASPFSLQVNSTLCSSLEPRKSKLDLASASLLYLPRRLFQIERRVFVLHLS